MGLFLLLIIGLFYTTNAREAGRDITLKISLILFPIAFAALPKIPKVHVKIAMATFLVALAVADIYALGNAGISYFTTNSSDVFFYDSLTFSRMVSVHHFSLYNSFGALVLMHYLLDTSSKALRKHQVLYWLGLLLFSVVVALLSVRIQYVALIISMGLVFFYHRKNLLMDKKKGLILLGLVLAILGGIMAMEGTQQRLRETLDEWNSMLGAGEGKQTNPRYYLWQEAFGVIGDNVVFGAGTGAGDDALQERVEKLDVYYWVGDGNLPLAEFRYNFHNEFLQHFATHGIFGFLLLLWLFLGPLTLSKFRKNPLVGVFLLLTFLSFLTESMLERQAGVLFFGFFYSLLIVNGENELEAVVDHPIVNK